MKRGNTPQYIARLLEVSVALEQGNVNTFELAVKFNTAPANIQHDVHLIRSFGIIVEPTPNETCESLRTLKLLSDDKGAETCELCHDYRKLITHHWTDQLGFHTKSLCNSCNTKLGIIFRGNYSTWEEQVKAIESKGRPHNSNSPE